MRSLPSSLRCFVLLLALPAACGPRGDEHEAPRPMASPESRLCVGGGHACFLTSNGEVSCSGRNLDGQLGDGTHADHARPVVAQGLLHASAVACGRAHTCAIASGSLHCWGRNDHGQLGSGDARNRSVPTKVEGLNDVVSVATGDDFTCATTADGRAHCMGASGDGRLGVARDEDARAPLRVRSVSNAVAITAGRAHACVLGRDGRVRCWGDGRHGQLGDGTSAARPYPRSVSSLEHVTSISAGGDTTCVVSEASVRCFGSGEHGQLGDDHVGPGYASARPVRVQNLGRVASVATSSRHVCARLESGRVACWGEGRRGELARGGFDSFPRPVEAVGASGARALAVGDGAGCIVRANGAFACWGSNAYGAFGNGGTAPGSVAIDSFESIDRAPRDAPRPGLSPVAASGETSETQRSVAVGDAHVCVVAADRSVHCTGNPDSGRLGHGSTAITGESSAVEVVGLSDALRVSAQGATTCALRANGRIACWGRGEGTLGLPGVRSSSAPIEVAGVSDARDVAVGRGFVCAVRTGGTVTCFGENGFGQLGVGDHLPSESMVQVAGIADATEVVAGGGFACALHASGRVSCWGDGMRGQLGTGETVGSTTPVEVAGLRDAVALAAGSADACAVRGNGALVCWGETAAGALDPEHAATTFAARPMAVPAIRDATRVAVGTGFACVLGAGGSVSCFGKNASAQAGAPPTERYRTSEPILVQAARESDPNVTLACGRDAACALTAEGSAFCWGGGEALASAAILTEGEALSHVPVPMRGLGP